MKQNLFIIAFLLVCYVDRNMAGEFDVVCGSPLDNPATIHYYGDVAAVFAYKHDEITNCMFQPVSHGVFSRQITFNLSDPCGFARTCGIREVYTIQLETRAFHELVQSDDDEEITVVCNFMPYTDGEVIIDVV